jgi:hypothetical protein
MRPTIACLGVVLATAVSAKEPRRNVFDDPFIPLTQGLAGCPAPPGPLLTESKGEGAGHAPARRRPRVPTARRDFMCKGSQDRPLARADTRAARGAACYGRWPR